MEELDLMELIKMFWRKKIWVIGIMAIFIIMAIIYTKTMIVPLYQSTSRVLFATDLSGNRTESGEQTTNNIANYQLIPTFAQLAKCDAVIEQVQENLGIEGDIKGNINIRRESNVEALDIVVSHSNPETAQKIANEVSKVFIEKIKEIYKLENIHIVNEAQVAGTPYNINLKKNVIVFGLLGIIISTIYILVVYMIDTKEKKLPM